jgi:hypothetical protein
MIANLISNGQVVGSALDMIKDKARANWDVAKWIDWTQLCVEARLNTLGTNNKHNKDECKWFDLSNLSKRQNKKIQNLAAEVKLKNKAICSC